MTDSDTVDGDISVPITKRYRIPVTQRFLPQAKMNVTRRYEAPKKTVETNQHITAGTLIDSYRVQEGPLGESTGEADVYRCWDELTQQEVAVKLYRQNMQPKREVIEQLRGLAHSHIVRLQHFGRWSGMFYEVMEFCYGGVIADRMPLTEVQLKDYLFPIIDGLHYCHEQGIVHRDLKPNNIFFRDSKQCEPLIGDFGISSYLNPEDEGVKVTQSASHLTLDYASPELLDGHAVSAKTDYYSLGITLIHLLLGHSPFVGQSTNDILVSHLRGRVHTPESASERFQLLLQGLIHIDPERRWGYEQVQDWLLGKNVAIAEQGGYKESALGPYSSPPYPGFQKALTPKMLASMLDQFDAKKQLFRGDIRRWVFDHFDEQLADSIEEIEERYTDQSELGLFKLRYLLDNEQPLVIGEYALRDLVGIVKLLRKHDDIINTEIEKALWNEQLEEWIDACKPAADRSSALIEQLKGLRLRISQLGHPMSAIFALRYILDPKQPLVISNSLSITYPAQIVDVFKKNNRVVHQSLKLLIYSHKFEEWIRACQFEGWQDDIMFLEDVRLRFLDEKDIGAYSVLWFYDPTLPFPFQKKAVKTPSQLALLIDRNEESWRQGINLLERGWIRAWLVSAGIVNDVSALDSVLLDTNNNAATKLEELLRLLDPAILPPKLSMAPGILNFGNVSQAHPRRQILIISNEGRGHLHGHIKLEDYGLGVIVGRSSFDGDKTEITIKVDSVGLSPGNYKTQLILHSNGGEAVLPIVFFVKDETVPDPWWQKLFDLISPP